MNDLRREHDRQDADQRQHQRDEQAEVVGHDDAEVFAEGLGVGFHRITAEIAAPASPMMPNQPTGMRGPLPRSASPAIAASAPSVTQSIGTIASI